MNNAVTKKKPWNRINSPVYSLSTRSAAGIGNMNICTYVTAVSLKPKLYVVAVYKGSQTLTNLEQGSPMVLQLLSTTHLALVRRFGFRSGKDHDKLKRLKLIEFHGLACLPDALSLLALTATEHYDSGDHVIYICAVTVWKNMTSGQQLSLNNLRDAGMIRA